MRHRQDAEVAGSPALAVRDLSAGYGSLEVLHGIALTVRPATALALVGANGAGKTTALRTIAGLLRPGRGSIELWGVDVAGRSAPELVRLGMVLVPQGRLVFPDQSVLDNLLLGAFIRPARARREDVELQLERFPKLRDRLDQLAGTLSGGEQQMVAIARALMGRPRVMLLDEPSMGLAPALVANLFATLAQLRAEGLSLIVVEQNIHAAFRIADHVCVLERGRIALQGTPAELVNAPHFATHYLGVSAS
jgi:branched-chain amino acid transport system ATP-binding protein